MSAGWLQAQFFAPLDDFALDLALSLPGDGVTALVGPSGAGKTSLLRCIAGLTRARGRLSVGGEIWQDERSFLPVHRRAVGFVFQEASLLPHLSVRRNLAFGARRLGRAPRIAAREVIALLDIDALLDRSPGNLSGGERQRVALGCALMSEPKLLLLDEPLAGLHAKAKADVLDHLERLHQAFATPILYVSHDRSEIDRIAHRTIELRAGRVVAATAGAPAPTRLESLSRSELMVLASRAVEAGVGPDMDRAIATAPKLVDRAS